MGGVRLRRIARLLPRHGWDPVVLTHPHDPASGVVLPNGVALEQVPAPDLTRAYAGLRRLLGSSRSASSTPRNEPSAKDVRLTSQINRWLMVPDKEVAWYRAACHRGRDLLREQKFDLIFASLPPRTTLLVAARLSRDAGLPAVLEFRDLWTGNPYHHVAQPTSVHRWLHQRLEGRVIRTACRVTALSRGIADHLSQRYASKLNAPIGLNYNFYDPEEYPADEPSAPGRRPFTVSYVGAMYGNRTPHQFFEGVRAFLNRQQLGPERFQFRWAGAISGVNNLTDVIDRCGIRPYLDFMGQLPHREALRLLMQSDAALIIQSPDDPIHVPGKLFEALGARVPVLALAKPCEVTEIIERCRAGLVSSHAPADIAEKLAQFYSRSSQGQPWDFNQAEIGRFSADASVERLSHLLDEASR